MVFGTKRTRHTTSHERGVSLVEYALLGALVLVVALAAIGQLETAATDDLEANAASAGQPDLDSTGYIPPPSGGSGTGGGSSGGGGSTTISPTLALASTTNTQGNSWSATVTATAVDPSNGNAPVPNVVVTGVWTPAVGSASTQCTTSSTGQCSMTQTGMEHRSFKPDYVASVSFQVTGASGTDISYTQSPAPSSGSIGAPP